MDLEIQKRLSIPVEIVVENDANVAALGSANYGAGRPFFYDRLMVEAAPAIPLSTQQGGEGWGEGGN